MADVRVRYTGKQPIIVNGVTWFQDEIHMVHEKTAQALVAMRDDVFVLPLPGVVAPVTIDGADGSDRSDGTTDDGLSMAKEMPEAEEELPVVEEKPKRRRK